MYIQTMDPADEDKFDFDPLDDTKIWPEDLFPLQVGYGSQCIGQPSMYPAGLGYFSPGFVCCGQLERNYKSGVGMSQA